jgi:hypothetical protein
MAASPLEKSNKKGCHTKTMGQCGTIGTSKNKKSGIDHSSTAMPWNCKG